uniref:Conserved plasma membrane protein n=1 Tax=Heligmosomoides polygyrus TaxID=6339 RepID=A0A183F8X5_HELPZ
LHVTPITYLEDSFPTMANYSRLSSGVIVQRGPCAPFQSQHSLPVFFDPVGLPVWETNFKRLVFYDSGQSAGDDDGKIWLWAMWIIIGLMLLLLLATLAVCCCCLLTARKPTDKPHISKDEEEQPLRGSPAPIPLLLERMFEQPTLMNVFSEYYYRM